MNLPVNAAIKNLSIGILVLPASKPTTSKKGLGINAKKNTAHPPYFLNIRPTFPFSNTSLIDSPPIYPVSSPNVLPKLKTSADNKGSPTNGNAANHNGPGNNILAVLNIPNRKRASYVIPIRLTYGAIHQLTPTKTRDISKYIQSIL